MEDVNSGGTGTTQGSFDEAEHPFLKSFDNSKPAATRARKKKAVLGQIRKKKLNKEASGKPGSASTVVVDNGGVHDWPGLLSSTSATESVAEGYKEKLTVGKKKGKLTPDFTKMEDSLRSPPFVFQKRLTRIDWRKLHTIDVDKIVREVDLDTLEAVVDTIAFGDIQGEDTRNFTEANFVKIFRIAQLMVEYLLHVQELLAGHKSQLLADGTTIQRRLEKHREKFAKLLIDLNQCRHDLKQAKKTLRIYEAILKVQGENQQQLQSQQQQQQSVTQQMVRCCPLCDKLFESSYYLDLHVARRHPKSNDMPEDKILAVVSKAEEATAARVSSVAWLPTVKAETTAALQVEIQQLRSLSQAEIQRNEAAAQFQIATLQASLKESNSKVQEIQNKLELLQTRVQSSPLTKLTELEDQLQRVQREVKDLTEEKSNLTKELESTKSEVSLLKAKKQRKVTASRKNIKGKVLHDQDMLSSTTSDSQDRLMRNGESSDRSSTEGTGGRGRLTRRKHQRYHRSSSPEKRGMEEKQRKNKKLKDYHSSPERKRAQKLRVDQSSKAERSRLPNRQDNSSSSTPTQRSNRHYEQCRFPERGPSDEHATLSGQFKVWKDSVASKQVRLKAADQEILGAAKADLQLDLARAEEKRVGREEVGKVGAVKKMRREDVNSAGRQKPTQQEGKFCVQKESTASEKRRLEADKEKERVAKETEQEEARRLSEIVDAASMDVGEDGPGIPVSEKEKPHVLSKYPHPPSVFSSKRDDLVHRLDEQLGGELRKFGFSSDTEGISDSIYQAATAALEKQNKHRAGALQTNQKKSLEYERGAIVWHTQRAVRERDIQIIESHFEEESDQTSRSGASRRAESASSEDEDEEHNTPLHEEKEKNKSRTPRSPQTKGQHHTGDVSNRDADLEKESHAAVTDKNRSADKQHVNYSANSFSRKEMNRFRIQSQSPSLSLFPSHHFKSSSRGQTTTKYSPPWHHISRDAEEEKSEPDNQGEAGFGLGQWESDEDVPHTQASSMKGLFKMSISQGDKSI
ncbi:hypothetical protein AXG93_509s1370 [Marchantia polymorpha subsp. ruderalis]|uniref:C2H2-type domain-containing protein n=1 Tax=Marchantia polymorpha subsp. ruderalis TaxID=1480154 RepID=A0A176W9I0_MARPO|nr:hypothetical protein AXG93_509s1370 [Marchantia polymorpha subsp. ruderalis]